MEQRLLGTTGKTISAVGLGCVTFGREIDEAASFRVLDHAVDSGITWFDTAEGYGGGNARESRRQRYGLDDVREVSGEVGSSERILGRWLKSRGCRNRVVICTKVSTGGGRENIHRALQTSLDRLGVDAVDVYLLHQYDPEVPAEETFGALDEAVSAGLAGCVGCSNYDAAALRRALRVCTDSGYAAPAVLQPPYSLAAPGAEEELFSLCRSEQIAVTTYSPLAAGFLTGKYTPNREAFPEGTRFHILPGHADRYFSDRNFRVVDRLLARAEEMGVPAVRLALAWAMSHPDVTAVLVGARTCEHIDTALAAHGMRLAPALREEMSRWE